jgi:hypothetical protein
VLGHPRQLVLGHVQPSRGPAGVARHEQMEMRPTVSPVPFSEGARTEYAGEGWRIVTR